MRHPVYKRVDVVGSLIETRRGSYFWLSLLLYDLAPSHASHPPGAVPPLRERHPSLPTSFSPDFYAVFIVIRVSLQEKEIIRHKSDVFVLYKREKKGG